MSSRSVLLAVALIAAATACRKEPASSQQATGSGSGSAAAVVAPADAASSNVKYGWYRAMLTLRDDHRVPFLLHLPPPGSPDKPMIANGEEHIPIKVEWAKDGVTILPDADPYKSEIDASISAPGQLAGRWHRYNPLWGDLDIQFTGDYIGEKEDPTQRYPKGPDTKEPLPNFAGTWHLQLEVRGNAIAELQQTPDGVVTGYYRAERFGDGQNMAGNIRGNRLYLSTFDGRSAATSLVAELTPQGTLDGELDMADKFSENLTGKREAGYKPDHTITLKGGAKKFPLKQLDGPTYKGKPTVVVLFATWCPVCAEVNETMLALYSQYHAQGLEVLGVAIDLAEDEKENNLRLDLYRKKWGIPWETFEVPGSPERFASVPPLDQIKGFEALPVTVFLNADHTVRAMYAGFDGIATGPKHVAAVEDFKRQTEAIVKKL